MPEASGEVRVDELLDDDGDLALEHGVKKFNDQYKAHTQYDQGCNQDDDPCLCVRQVKLGEQSLA